MPVLFGLLASLLIGISDYFGRFCSRRAPAMTALSTAFWGGLAATALLVLVVPSDLIATDFALGVASGGLVAIALSAMWFGMAVSSTAIVSPIVALTASLGPLSYGIATGERPTVLTAIGIGVAITGLLLSVIVPHTGGSIGKGIASALVAGVSFAATAVILGLTHEDSGMWPVASQRMAALVFLAPTIRWRRIPFLLPRNLRVAGFLGGIAGGAGMASWVAGLQRGPVGEVAVAGSLYPVATIALAVAFDHDTLRWWQAVGIVTVLAGTALITIG